MILGVDASLPLMSVAIIDDTRTLGAVAVRGEASRNEKLLPAIDWMLRQAEIEPSAITMFAVTRGPGSFTGLRIGLATVQGMARASGHPVCATSTLHAAAFDGEKGRVLVLSDAGRGEAYAAIYDRGVEISAPAIVGAREEEALRVSVERVLDLRESADSLNVALRAAHLARFLAGEGLSHRYAEATPMYVRAPAAEPNTAV